MRRRQRIESVQEQGAAEQETFVDEVAKRTVLRKVREIINRSNVIRKAGREGNVVVPRALYDVKSGELNFSWNRCIRTTRSYLWQSQKY